MQIRHSKHNGKYKFLSFIESPSFKKIKNYNTNDDVREEEEVEEKKKKMKKKKKEKEEK